MPQSQQHLAALACATRAHRAEQAVEIRKKLPTTGRMFWLNLAMCRSDCQLQAEIGLIRPIPYYHKLLFFSSVALRYGTVPNQVRAWARDGGKSRNRAA